MTHRSGSLAVITIVMAGLAALRAQSIDVPAGAQIVIDGTIGEAEWAGARTETMEGGGMVFLRRTDTTLYVGVRGTADGIAHLCVATGDAVRLLHASAAIGSAVYRRSGEGFAKATDFDWQLRDPALTGAAAAARAAYLEREAWVGTVSRMGPAVEREFAVARRAWAGGPIRVAVGYVTLPARAVSRWPAGATDCAAAELIAGFLPDTASFRPDAWADLR